VKQQFLDFSAYFPLTRVRKQIACAVIADCTCTWDKLENPA
jgi:hypothetical protein